MAEVAARSRRSGEQYGGAEWSETDPGCCRDGVSTVDGSWWAIITYKVIKDIGRQQEKGHAEERWATADGGRGEEEEGEEEGWSEGGNGQFRECDIYIVIKSREQVGPLGKILVLEQLQTH